MAIEEASLRWLLRGLRSALGDSEQPGPGDSDPPADVLAWWDLVRAGDLALVRAALLRAQGQALAEATVALTRPGRVAVAARTTVVALDVLADYNGLVDPPRAWEKVVASAPDGRGGHLTKRTARRWVSGFAVPAMARHVGAPPASVGDRPGRLDPEPHHRLATLERPRAPARQRQSRHQRYRRRQLADHLARAYPPTHRVPWYRPDLVAIDGAPVGVVSAVDQALRGERLEVEGALAVLVGHLERHRFGGEDAPFTATVVRVVFDQFRWQRAGPPQPALAPPTRRAWARALEDLETRATIAATTFGRVREDPRLWPVGLALAHDRERRGLDPARAVAHAMELSIIGTAWSDPSVAKLLDDAVLAAWRLEGPRREALLRDLRHARTGIALRRAQDHLIAREDGAARRVVERALGEAEKVASTDVDDPRLRTASRLRLGELWVLRALAAAGARKRSDEAAAAEGQIQRAARLLPEALNASEVAFTLHRTSLLVALARRDADGAGQALGQMTAPGLRGELARFPRWQVAIEESAAMAAEAGLGSFDLGRLPRRHTWDDEVALYRTRRLWGAIRERVRARSS